MKMRETSRGYDKKLTDNNKMEEPLPPYGSCNLSSINLSEFVIYPFTKNAKFNIDEFKKLVRDGVNYLNEVLDENMYNHPLPQQTEVSRDLRQIGLGCMGVADMFIKLGVKYGSDESLDIIRLIGNTMINEALQESALLAKKYGVFPRYNADKVLNSKFLLTVASDETLSMVKQYGLRNSQLLTLAPTGSISTLIGVSGGLEPIFSNSYTRMSESLGENGEKIYYKVYAPIVQEYMQRVCINSEDDLPEYFVTSHDITAYERLKIQSTWQEYIDASISSTINLPNETSVDEVFEIYFKAWQMGLKGVTIYRDGCARSGVLTTEKPKKKEQVIDNEVGGECAT